MPEGLVTLAAGREKTIERRHPWIFSGAIAKEKNAVPGEIVSVVDTRGQFLARGYYNPTSQIRVRVLTWQDRFIDEEWWETKLRRAINGRLGRFADPNAGTRLINAENDFIPGLIVDRYGDWLVLQALTLFIDKNKKMIAQMLAEMLPIKGIYERSDVDVREKEGLKETVGVLWGEEPPEVIYIHEGTIRLPVDVRTGHKTGFYLDQSANRLMLPELIKQNPSMDERCDVLNLFSFTGGFSLHALTLPQTFVTNVDLSANALAVGQQALTDNGLDAKRAEWIEENAFGFLRGEFAEERQYEVVVLDPPKFAPHEKQIEKAARGYKDLNLYSFRIVRPGGYLLTFSCSGAISQDLFQKIVFGALEDSKRDAQIVQHLSAAPDHPIALTFPEGQYLKGLLLKVY